MRPLPKSVKVGYRDYILVDWPAREAMSARRYGETQHITLTIKIDLSHGHREAAETLLHEVLHAIAYVWTLEDEDKEERTVRVLSSGLATVWRDNPTVIAWIAEGLK